MSVTRSTILSLHYRDGRKSAIGGDQIWEEITVPNNALLIHSFETRNEVGKSHQIDTLFVCPHFIFILEIKNISGSIWYEKNKHQLLRRKGNGEVESFQSPLDQVQRHADLIERIVGRLGYPLPVHKAVVIAKAPPSLVTYRMKFRFSMRLVCLVR